MFLGHPWRSRARRLIPAAVLLWHPGLTGCARSGEDSNVIALASADDVSRVAVYDVDGALVFGCSRDGAGTCRMRVAESDPSLVLVTAQRTLLSESRIEVFDSADRLLFQGELVVHGTIADCGNGCRCTDKGAVVDLSEPAQSSERPSGCAPPRHARTPSQSWWWPAPPPRRRYAGIGRQAVSAGCDASAPCGGEPGRLHGAALTDVNFVGPVG